MALTPALALDRVSFAYGPIAALSEVSFALAPGERAALLGRNGAGKSTVARLIAGLLRPAAGTVWVGDWDTGHHPPEALAHRVGSLFQHADQQLFGRTLADDVRFGPRALGLPPPEVERRAAAALAALDLDPLAGEHPYDLAPALRKLAALAGTLALEPSLLVLDEPTGGLDRELRARVVRALLARASAGVALLVITHDLTFAAETLERGLVLDAGRLSGDAPLAELLVAPSRLEPVGLLPPPIAALATALALPGRPVREADARRVLARVAHVRPSA